MDPFQGRPQGLIVVLVVSSQVRWPKSALSWTRVGQLKSDKPAPRGTRASCRAPRLGPTVDRRPAAPFTRSVLLALAHELDRERVAELRRGGSGTADDHGEHPAELVLLLQRRAGRLAELQDDALALVARYREGHPAVHRQGLRLRAGRRGVPRSRARERGAAFTAGGVFAAGDEHELAPVDRLFGAGFD